MKRKKVKLLLFVSFALLSLFVPMGKYKEADAAIVYGYKCKNCGYWATGVRHVELARFHAIWYKHTLEYKVYSMAC